MASNQSNLGPVFTGDEMKITDEQYYDAGQAVVHGHGDNGRGMLRHLPKGITWRYENLGDERGAKIAAGRASLEFWAPILLAEPSLGEIGESGNGGKDDFLDGRQVSRIIDLFSRRLRSVLAKSDPAIEAVGEYLANLGVHAKVADISDEQLGQIVAAVDAARKANSNA